MKTCTYCKTSAIAAKKTNCPNCGASDFLLPVPQYEYTCSGSVQHAEIVAAQMAAMTSRGMQ